MRAAVIENGVVINIIMAEDPAKFDAVACADEVQKGWSFSKGTFTAPAEEPAPDPEPAPVLHSLSKNLMWERVTDAEAVKMNAALMSQPIRIIRIYEGATYISNEAELYTLLHAALTQLFGAARADEILEPNF